MDVRYLAEKCIAPAEIQEGDLVAYLEGVASPTVVRHLHRCPVCWAEAETLRSVEITLGRALRRPATALLPERRPAWPRLNLAGLFQPQIMLPVLAGLIIIGFSAGLLISLNHREPFGPVDEITQGATSLPADAAEATGADRPVLIGAANPDVDPRRIIRHMQETQPVGPDIVALPVGRSGQRGSPTVDRYATVHPGVVDIAIASRFFREEPYEIAPPLRLRQQQQNNYQRAEEIYFFETGTYSNRSHIVGPDDNDYLVRAENRNGVTVLYFAYSSDKGASWSSDVSIAIGVGRVFNPKLATDTQGNFYVIWRNWFNIDSNIFYFARSTDGGQSWDNPIRIEHSSGTTLAPDLAVDNNSGHLYVTWERYLNANTGIFFTHSADGGQTWSNKERLAHIGS